MAYTNGRSREVVHSTWQSLVPDGLTPQQAKLYSHHILLSLNRPGLQSYTDKDTAARMAESELLLATVHLARSAEPDGNWRAAAKRAGELLEWMSHEGLLSSAVPGTALAGAAYQLAGYPAMANAVIGSDAARERSNGEQLLRAFLAGDFVAVERHAPSELMLLDRKLEHDVGGLSESIGIWLMRESIRCLLCLCCYLRWGDSSRLSEVLNKLAAVSAATAHSRVEYSALAARLCVMVAAQYASTAIWRAITPLTDDVEKSRGDALRKFARRLYQRGRALTWPSQQVGIERLAKGDSFVLCTPTGSGKTLIAELGLLSNLIRSGAEGDWAGSVGPPLGLYLVPSKALAAEVEGRLSSDLSGVLAGPLVVTGLYGGIDWGPTDAWLTTEHPAVLICTYEKAEALLRYLGPLITGRIACIVIDEAHSVKYSGATDALRAGEERALRLESLLTRVLRMVDGAKCRLIALSAVTAGLEGRLSAWLVGETNEGPVRSNYRSARQLVGRLVCSNRGYRIEYNLVDRRRLSFSDIQDAPFIPDPFGRHPPAPSHEAKGPIVQLRPYLLWAGIQLASPDPKGKQHTVLLSVTSQVSAYAKSFLDLLDRDWAGADLPRYFSAPTREEDARLWSECLACAEDYFTSRSHEYLLLERGVAVHHGKLPAPLARRLKEVVERGIVRVVLATSTLSEGVNLPVEYILIPDLHRANIPLSVQEFLNLVGRAGRPGYGTEGRTLVLLPPRPAPRRRDRAAYSAGRLIDAYESLIEEVDRDRGGGEAESAVSPLAELLRLIQREWNAVASSQDEAKFLGWMETAVVSDVMENAKAQSLGESVDTLDGFLISALEEAQQISAEDTELTSAFVETSLRRVWSKTFARVAADTESRLEEMVLHRGRSVPRNYPKRSERRQIYKTSLPPRTARVLLAQMPKFREALVAGANYAEWEVDERCRFVEKLVGMLGDIPQFAPAIKIGKAKMDWRLALRWWLDPDGAPICPTPDQMERWHDYVAKYFSYRATWGIGSLLSLFLEDAQGGGGAIALRLEDWPRSGLPWISFWLRELLVWGTHDPMAAYVLSRGRAVTRKQALSTAKIYYGESSDVGDGLLDPRPMRAWLDNGVDRVVVREVRGEREIAVMLVREAAAFKSDTLRVYPVVDSVKDELVWVDVAGYRVAVSTADAYAKEWSVTELEFVLNVQTSRVAVGPYV